MISRIEEFINAVLHFNGIVIILLLSVIAIFLFFVFFWFRGIYLYRKFGRILSSINKIDANNLTAMTKVCHEDARLLHIWQEYEETLHKQKQIDSQTGILQLVAARSTVPAETFFNAGALVDSRLKTDFFKHAPGILTGIGIIGTFSGLIGGLQRFAVSEEPTVVRNSLESLLHGVSEAFLVSAIAIGLAMLMTLLDKVLLTALHGRVEALAQCIDSKFVAGAGEEYLLRLVTASEESSSQTRILKDSLVNDLRSILTELCERQVRAVLDSSSQFGRTIDERLSEGTREQIAAAESAGTQLADRIASSIESGLKGPLDDIARAVGTVSEERGAGVQKLLTDVLCSFSERLETLLGGQISGINQLQQQTVQSLEAAILGLQQMVAGIEAAGRNSTDAMTARLSDALASLEARQRLMNEQMTAFVEQIRAQIGQSQNDTSAKLQAILGELGERIGNMIGTLSEQAAAAARAHGDREAQISERAEQTATLLGGQVETLLDELRKATAATRSSVETMAGVTADATSRMNGAAETLMVAASDFAEAGRSVAGVLDKTVAVSATLAQSGASVAAAARPLEVALADYKAAREAMLQLVPSLEAVVANARKEASLTADALQRIEQAAVKLAEAQQQADRYLEEASEVLAECHDEFATNLRKTLGDANTEFYKHLKTATGLLSESIQELESSIGGFTPQSEARRQ